MKAKEVPPEFWGEVVRHSAYVLNKLPTRALSSNTPYEAWFGSKPNMSDIRIFGCCVFMKLDTMYSHEKIG